MIKKSLLIFFIIFINKSDNSNVFYLGNPTTLVRNYRSIVDDVYSTYQLSNDNFRKSEQRLDDLKEEYDLD